jgi:hypothetical protein
MRIIVGKFVTVSSKGNGKQLPQFFGIGTVWGMRVSGLSGYIELVWILSRSPGKAGRRSTKKSLWRRYS